MSLIGYLTQSCGPKLLHSTWFCLLVYPVFQVKTWLPPSWFKKKRKKKKLNLTYEEHSSIDTIWLFGRVRIRFFLSETRIILVYVFSIIKFVNLFNTYINLFFKKYVQITYILQSMWKMRVFVSWKIRMHVYNTRIF